MPGLAGFLIGFCRRVHCGLSRGRAVCEFITCILNIPSLAGVASMTVLGGTALSGAVNEGPATVGDPAAELRLFAVLAGLPLPGLTCFIGIRLEVIIVIASSDPGRWSSMPSRRSCGAFSKGWLGLQC